jgi:hypothetical protein
MLGEGIADFLVKCTPFPASRPLRVIFRGWAVGLIELSAIQDVLPCFMP